MNLDTAMKTDALPETDNARQEIAPDKYMLEVRKLVSNSFHGDNVPLASFATRIGRAIAVLELLDEVKKLIFYGVKPGVRESLMVPEERLIDGQKELDCMGLAKTDVDEILIHGILGMATEAGEALEWLNAYLFAEDKPALSNLIEEMGDSNWYQNAMLDKFGFTVGEVNHINITKLLTKRFKKGFNEVDANTRDLKAEGEFLEKAVSGTVGRLEAEKQISDALYSPNTKPNSEMMLNADGSRSIFDDVDQ